MPTADGRRSRELIAADFRKTPEELKPLDTKFEQRNGCNLCPAGFEIRESHLGGVLETEHAKSNTNAERTTQCR